MENHTPDRPLAGGQRVFTCGHPSSTLRMLLADSHFFGIYLRGAVGLPSPGVLSGEPGGDDVLNRILQQLAWDAVTQHPLSGDCDGTVQSSG